MPETNKPGPYLPTRRGSGSQQDESRKKPPLNQETEGLNIISAEQCYGPEGETESLSLADRNLEPELRRIEPWVKKIRVRKKKKQVQLKKTNKETQRTVFNGEVLFKTFLVLFGTVKVWKRVQRKANKFSPKSLADSSVQSRTNFNCRTSFRT